MELVTLNESRVESKLIQGYDSLLWTERFNQRIGDCVLTTGDIDRFMNLLPEGKLVTLRDTNQVMRIETHKIERKKGSPAKLTITGSAFESILGWRVAFNPGVDPSQNWTLYLKQPSDVAYGVMWLFCVFSERDKFPTDVVSFPVPPDQNDPYRPPQNYDVPTGNLLTVVLQFLQQEAATEPGIPQIFQHGIRSRKPPPSGGPIKIEIYAGIDRSETVYFDATRRLLDDGTYLFSKVGSANVAYGVDTDLFVNMYEGAVEPTGMDRRTILVDASGSGYGNDPEILKNYMSMSLSEASETAMFDGTINPDVNPYIYGEDYGLGDIVKVVGDYGLNEYARVTEFIRSEDATGEKAYPTLETLIT